MREICDFDFPERTCDANIFKVPPTAAALNHIYKRILKDCLSREALNDLADDLKTVTGKFGISENSAVLLSHIAEFNNTSGTDENELASFIGCSNIEFIGMFECLYELEKKGIVVRAPGMRHRFSFFVSREAMKSIVNNTDFVPIKMTDLTADELFTRIALFFAEFKRETIGVERLLNEVTHLIKNNQHLIFCQRVAASSLSECSETQQRVFFYLCHEYIMRCETATPIEKLVRFTDFDEDASLLRRSIANEKTSLQKNGLVTFGGDDGFQDKSTLTLTEEVRNTFFDDVTVVRQQATQHRDLLKCNDIAPKALYYNAREQEQMDRLEQLLQPENFRGVQTRLEEIHMRKGFAVLFTGVAGSGKTAGVYELARRTGRDIFAVDMSQLKSKWVGDSEKIVKGVFRTYKQMCARSENAPILLFNEADAIFSKRIENPDDSVDQMMNAIQNICLDAIENLDGILIATTNLAVNFCDEAFARRFIFKIDFTTPEPSTRAKIWKSMLDYLSDEEAESLGRSYTFSGGNIENITRKAAVEYALTGNTSGIDTLRKYCEEETFSAGPKRPKIGF